MSQPLTDQNFQVIIRVRPLNIKEQQQIQSYQYAQSKKFKTSSSNNKMIKLSPTAYAFYTKFYNVQSLSDIMKVQNNDTIYVIDTEYKNSQKKLKPFVFSHVYNQKETSEEIFDHSINQQINCIFDGYNYTILAYGITGSGKTHTVFGSYEKNQVGISGLALNHLLTRKCQLQRDSTIKVNLKFSFVQIYNENVRDLLNSEGKMLNIIEDTKGNTAFTDAIEIQVHSKQQIQQLINIGLTKRSSGATMANQYSSRSHAILQMNVEIARDNGSKVTAKMFIIDLAGSEKIQTLNTAKKMLEGANINKSLLALGNCINILAENSKKGMNGSTSATHIPYRDSKLTRILKDSLGGNAKTLMVACVSENPFTIQQTITTLNYAQRAQVIKKEVKRNKSSDEDGKKVCSKCMGDMNCDDQISSKQKIRLPQYLTSSSNTPKEDMLETFFEQIYDDIMENMKEKISIERILSSENRNRISIEQLQKIKQVNENQRIQLKDTMWKLFMQKQQDYCQKLSELNQFVQRFNDQQEKREKREKSKQKGNEQMRKSNLITEQQNSNELWGNNSNSIAKRNSSQKHRSISLSRRPLQLRDNNQQQVQYIKPHDSIKFLTDQRQIPDENSHVRFSFASLLTSEGVSKVQPMQQYQDAQIQRSAEKLTKRKKSRSKFEVVKRMSASKLDSKESGEVSL